MMTSSTPPVLFVIFRRPDVTRQVFEAIRKAKPKQLFVCADGPRLHVAGEAQLCEQTREIIKSVDWDCQVFTKFSDVNLGCRNAVSSGITWFFEHVESGIILEDDCLPSLSFFTFCQELLGKYKDDERVMQISGVNYLPGADIGLDSYYFSKINDIWGWATWRRAWKLYDIKIDQYPEFKRQGRIYDYFDDPKQAAWLMSYFDEVLETKKGIWSPQWTFAMLINNGLTICPSVPLTVNIGMNADGMSFEKCQLRYPKVQLQEMGAIVHPSVILPSRKMDALRFELICKTDPHAKCSYHWKRSVKNRLKNILKPEMYERFMVFQRKLRGYS